MEVQDLRRQEGNLDARRRMLVELAAKAIGGRICCSQTNCYTRLSMEDYEITDPVYHLEAWRVSGL